MYHDSDYLTSMFNSFETSTFPRAWKKSEVVPHLKKHHELPNNNRPISLLPNLEGSREDRAQPVSSLFDDTHGIDLSKAFDSISHSLLLNKLCNIGTSANALKWFESYLSDRQQTTRLGPSLSSPLTATHGEPQ